MFQTILKENSATPGDDKVTLRFVPKTDKHQGEKEAKKLASKGVRGCRDVLCGC